MADLDCLDTLVGLAPAAISCFTDAAPSGYNTSDSGYYLSDPDYGFKVIEACQLPGWAIFNDALANAIADFKNDLSASLRTEYDSALSPFSGHIGRLKSSGVGNPSKAFIGQRIQAVPARKGAALVIKKIWIGVDVGASYDVHITSNDPTFVPPAPITIIATGNQFTGQVLSPVIELPMYSKAMDGDDVLEYYITYERTGARPLANNFYCCGNLPAWKDQFVVDGIGATDENATSPVFSSEGQGLSLEAYLICNDLDWICQLEELNGYQTLSVVARTIQFRAGALAIAGFVDRPELTACTSYNLKSLQERRNWLNKRYSENIAWLTENIPLAVTDCFRCKPTQQIFRTKIQS